jgi:hypothetical protein
MKKYTLISFAAATAGMIAFSLPIITSAQTAVDADAAAGVSASVDAGQTPPPGATNTRDTLRRRLQQNYTTYNANIRNNEDYRNTAMEGRLGSSTRRVGMMGSSTMPGRPLMTGRFASSTGFSSSTMRERMQSARKDIFDKMRDRLVDQLNHAIANLKQIRGRIVSRIAIETGNGRDMTSANAALVIADAKIKAAEQAIADLTNIVPPPAPIVSSTTASASSTAVASTSTRGDDRFENVGLGQPRMIGAAAIKAVNDARRALNDVVVAIAHSMGLKVGADGHIEDENASSTDRDGRSASSTQQ